MLLISVFLFCLFVWSFHDFEEPDKGRYHNYNIENDSDNPECT